MNTTSESLLIRLREMQDQQAWSKFVQLYTPLLFYWARNTGLKTSDASDLVQEVLTIVFQKLPTFQYDADKSFRGWLRTITLNKYREWCRRKSLGAHAATQSVLAGVAGNEKVAQSTWDLNYQQALVASAMELVEKEFLPKTWGALREYVLEGKPAADVAEQTGVSVWTIYAAKSRLMKRLREVLDGLME